jgi:acetyl esterase/lipase
MLVDERIRRTADLHLRGREGSVTVRVRWPVTDAPRPPLALFLPDAGPASGVDAADDELCRELCAGLAAVTLCAPWSTHGDGAPYSPLERASAALEWSADHAAELGADPARIVVAGRGAGAAAAAVLAVRARDRGWPGIVRQLLFLASPPVAREGQGACETARSALGLVRASGPGPCPAPASVIAGDGVAEDHRARCAQRLRAAGIAVDEYGLAERADLWRSLRAALGRERHHEWVREESA